MKEVEKMAEATVPAPQTEGHVSEQQAPQAPREETREQARTITPPVDIFETQEGLIVIADIPGVSKDGIDVRVENDILTITGTVSAELPGESVRREYELANYFRQFQLSDKVDVEKISAELRHGVLTVHLPKPEAQKPRQIDVKVS